MEPNKMNGILKRTILILMTMILIISSVITLKNKVLNENSKIVGNSELQRAMTYDQFEDGDENIEGTDNVKFSAFFLRDLDGDGYAEKIKGTCKHIAKDQDTLYMEINVLTKGYLKDAKIEIDGKNFYLQTTLPKDNELKDDYIGSNIKTIEFENLNNGTQKLLTGIVRSGDYTNSSSKKAAIGNNINNYSREDNTITLSGTYIAEDGTETEITKQIPLIMDWYGETGASISSGTQNNYDIANRIDEENGTLTLTFSVNTVETKDQLNISKNYVQGTIPELNGYAPTSVALKSGAGTYTYDETTRIFTITKTAETNDEGTITSSLSRYLYNTIEVVYPIEAYTSIGTEMVTIKVPVSTYYEGYNNPNDEFDNPYKSNNATATLVANYMPEKGSVASFEIKVGKYVSTPSGRYIVSKRKPLRLYNEISSEETDDTYVVMWKAYTGTDGETEGLVLKETKDNETQKVDTFIKSDSSEDSMEDITTNVGIYFSNATSMLGEDGEIKVYDEDTGILVHTFTSSDWNRYTSSNPYKYDTAIKHVKIVTSSTNKETTLYVYNIKELDDEKIIETYTKDEFDTLSYIESNLVMYLGDTYQGSKVHQAHYEAPYSLSTISLSKNVISTQSTEEGLNIYVKSTADESINQIEWTNGEYLIKLPDEVLSLKINSVEINNTSVNINSYEYVENTNGKFIKIKTSNINPASYTITINVDITADPRNASATKDITLYAKNEEGENYYYSGQDIYDIDSDGNVEELVNVRNTSISMIAPNSLLTNQTMSDYDEEETIVVSPEVAELKPIYGESDLEKQTVKIGAQIKNNYSSTISEVLMLGKIPFEGNTYVLSGGDLSSDFSTTMTNTGITVPTELQDSVTVYYSTNENPSKDITDTNNGWTLAEDVTDWTAIKTWLIDFEDTIIEQGAEYVFYYTVEIPFGVEFNKVVYSHHGIYFSLDTTEGKYRTQTEPNKIGVMIADKYNLLLTKYQKDNTKLIEGATYRVSKLDDEGNIEESQTAITNSTGTLEMANLYAEKAYEIKEIQSPTDYELNEDIIKIIGHISRDTGVLTVEKTEGTLRDDLQIIKNDGEDYKVQVNVEDEVKAKLKITKYEEGTTNVISGVRYKITGNGLPESGKNVSTNVNGEISLSGIKIGEEYTLEEIKAEGYYINDQIKFSIINNNGTYELNVTEGTIKTNTITLEDSLPIVNIEIEDEKIPTYDLVISKIEKGTGIEGIEAVSISGAKFKLYKEDKEIGKYETDSEGHITINGLYQYEEEKDIGQTYVLKETYAPEGYAKTKDITFKGQVVEGELKLISEETDNYSVDGTTINLIIEDSKSFKLVKKDGETSELLPNVKFAIYNVDEGQQPARNSKGEIIGTKETINGVEYYTVTTNAYGEITADLPEGIYKAVEIEAEEKYDIENQEQYFGIGASREGKSIYTPEYATSIGGTSDEYINSVSETADGGYIVGGYFRSSSIEIGEYTLTNAGSSDGMLIKYSSSGAVEWAQSVGGTSNEEINSVSSTADGGYIVGGYFYSSSLEVGEYTLTNKLSGCSDGMIIKYSSSGAVEWAQSVGGTSEDQINSVSETADGGYIVGGYFWSSSIEVGEYTLTNAGSSDGMLIKYSSSGAVEWAQSVGGTEYDCINSVSETADRGYIVGGHFSSSSLEVGEYTLTRSGYEDGMIIKYSSSGAVEWAQSVGGTSSDYIYSVSSTADGGYIVGGYFWSSSIEVGEYTLTNAGSSDGMIIKYSSSGAVEWAQSVGGRNIDYIYSVSETADGGYIVGGYFYSSLEVGEYTLTNKNSGYADGMLIKYSSSGAVEWAQSVGGTSDDRINSVSSTADGGYIVGGYFRSSSIEIGEYTLTNKNSGYADGMLIKYSLKEIPEVVYKHATSVGGTSDDRINSVSSTADGGYIVGGYFYSSSLEVGEYTLTNATTNGLSDGMVIKYSSSGEVEWAQSVGGTSEDQITSVSETADGGYIVGGHFSSSSLEVGEYTLTRSGYEDGMIIKYSSSGAVEWAQSVGGTSDDRINSVSSTADGGYIVGGYFYSSSLEVGEYTLTNKLSGCSDGMIIKYSSSGAVEWAQSVGGTSNEEINSVSSTADGGYIVGGRFQSSSLEVGEYILTRSGGYDGMVIKYRSSGAVEWAQSVGGTNNDYIYSVSETADGGYIVGGYFESSSLEVGEYTLTRSGGNDGMVIKYRSSGAVEWAQSVGGTSDDRINSVSSTADGGYIVGGYFYSSSLEVGEYTLTNKNSGYADGMLIKYSSSGAVEWAQSVGGTRGELIYSVSETADRGYIVGGYFYSSSLEVGEYTLTNAGSTSHTDGMVIKINAYMGAPEQEEITFVNNRKEYKITTDIKEIDGVKGGSISGEDLSPYEKVKYGDTSTKQIIMTPDTDYEIIGITVNGNDWQYEELSDGSYIMPQFENVTEDKHIVVTYSLKDNKITINKVDSISGEKLSDVEFGLDQIEERTEPDNTSIIGSLTDNGQEYTNVVVDTEITSGLGSITNNGTYYFVENTDGSLVPTNSKTYQVANVEGATTGVKSSTANSYVEIDLTEKTGTYAVVVNAYCSSEGSDYGYATITSNTTAPTYSSTTGRFMYVSGTSNEKDYISAVLEGGSKYYLHLGYRKDSSVDTGEDQIVINSIKLYSATENSTSYSFVNNAGIYESTNQGINSTVCNSYIPIDMTGYSGKYNITINAEVSTASGDYGYATLTQNTTAPSHDSSTGRIVNITTTQSAKDYTMEIDGGYQYYLHLGYYKNATTNTSGDDVFKVNSINISLSDSELYHTTVTTNSEGQAITQIPFGKYSITELSTQEGYWLLEDPEIIEFRSTEGAVHEFTISNEKKAKVIVHHYIKDTETKLAEDEEILGKIGEEYETSPNLDIENYTLEKDQEGKYILPSNANGTYTYEDIEVIYYYVEKEIPLTVHHYIEGTQTSVPMLDGSTAEDVVTSGQKGTIYTTEAIEDSLLDERYELSETPSNASGTYGEEEIVVTYYYKEVQRDVVITKVDEDGVTPLENAEFTLSQANTTGNATSYITNANGKINLSLKAGEYILEEIDAPEGYEIPANNTQTITINKTSGNQDITIGNEKERGTVKVHYYIEGTETKVPTQSGGTVEDITKEGIVGEIYATSEAENVHENYELVSIPDNSSGEYIDGEIVVTYYYKLKTSRVITHHYIEGTQTSISADVTVEKNVGETYTTSIASDIPEYYELVSEPTNKEGSVVLTDTHVYYYYRLKKYPYTVNYIDKDTNKTIHISKTVENITYGTEITAINEKINIPGYEYDSIDKEVLTIGTNNNVINIYYTKAMIGYTVEYYYDGVKNNDKTETLSAEYQSQISTYTDKNITGYKLEKTENLPLTITEIAEDNVIKVYYVKDNFGYTVEYYYDGVKNNDKTETLSAEYQSQISTYTDKNITGYKLEKTENLPLTITELADNNVIKVYYVKDNFGYTVEYYYDGVKNNDKTEISSAEYQSQISTYTDKNITGYKLEKTENLPLTISEIAENNVIKVYYVKDNFGYTVEYYYDGVKNNDKTETLSAEYQSQISTYTDKNITGYKLEKTENLPLTISEIAEDNVIKVYYVKDNFGYTVEYYYDGVKNSDKTETSSAEYQSTISTYTDKNITGYKLEKTENLPLTISEIAENNVIKVYYIVDDGTTKTLSYTVEYYKDNVKVDSDTISTSITVQILEPDTITLDRTLINNNDKYVGYKLEKTDPTTVADEVSNGDVIKVYYVKDNFGYTVEYYYDGVKNSDKTETSSAEYQSQISTYTDKNITGYKLEKTENLPLTITEIAEDNVIKVYYVKDNFGYTVEYYYDGVKNNDKTEILSAEYQSQISTYTDKNITGYKLEKTENLPLTISEIAEDNVIKVYYVKDNFGYTVEYYYDGIKNNDKTETLSAEYQSQISTYTEKNITGYKLEKTENLPLTISEIAENNVIKVYYVKDNFGYTVEYYYDGVKNNDKTETLLAEYQSQISTYTDKNITGYKLEKTENLPLTITENAEDNIIKVYYVKDNAQTKEISYTVEYYKNNEIQVDDTEQVKETVQVLADDTLNVDKSSINVIDKYPGYIFEKTDPTEIPDTITNGGVIKVYYVKTKYPYSIEYYYDNVKDDTATEEGNAYKGTVIDSYTNKVKSGYEFEEVVGLPLVISDTEENIVKVYYLPIRKITINHIDKNSGEIIQTEEKTGKDGYTITTESIDIPGYTIIEKPTTEEYTYTEVDQVVNYYYAKVSSGVLEKHIDLINNKPIAEDKTYEGYAGKSYTTTSKDIDEYSVATNEEYYTSLIEKDSTFLSTAGVDTIEEYFELKDLKATDPYIPENYIGTMTEGLIEVRYYYVPTTKLIVRYIDITTGEEIVKQVDGKQVSTTIEKAGKYNEEYTTKLESFDNYLPITNEMYYTRYFNDNPNVLEELNISTVEEYLTKNNIDADANYIPENANGKLGVIINPDGTYSSQTIVTYYYSVEREVIVRYYDQNTGEEISQEVVKIGIDGQIYDLKDTEKEIEGYTLVAEPTSVGGIYQEENETRKYYFAKNTQIVVKYVDKETGEELVTKETVKGYIGKEYTTKEKEITGYKYVSSTDNTTGAMTEDTLEVIYYYNKQKYSTYTINYLDADTRKPIKEPKEVKDQKVETTIYAKALIIDIANYTFDHFDKDSIIIKEGENTINLYYTKNEEPKKEPTKQEPKIITVKTPEEKSVLKEPDNSVRITNTGKSTYIDKVLGMILIFTGCVIIIVSKISDIHNKRKE